MNNQEIFNIAVRGIRKQGKPSMDSGTCCYRTSDGLMCALGQVLVPLGCYDPAMENSIPSMSSAKELWVQLRKAGIEEHQAMFLRSLQSAHDDPVGEPEYVNEFMSIFLYKAKQVAIAYYLDATVCEE